MRKLARICLELLLVRRAAFNKTVKRTHKLKNAALHNVGRAVCKRARKRHTRSERYLACFCKKLHILQQLQLVDVRKRVDVLNNVRKKCIVVVNNCMRVVAHVKTQRRGGLRAGFFVGINGAVLFAHNSRHNVPVRRQRNLPEALLVLMLANKELLLLKLNGIFLKTCRNNGIARLLKPRFHNGAHVKAARLFKRVPQIGTFGIAISVSLKIRFKAVTQRFITHKRTHHNKQARTFGIHDSTVKNRIDFCRIFNHYVHRLHTIGCIACKCQRWL